MPRRSHRARASLAALGALVGTGGLVAVAAPAQASVDKNVDFATPGTYTWRVPAAVDSIQVRVSGAAGGLSVTRAGTPGRGDTVTATVPVQGGQVLTVTVGSKGGVGANAGVPGGGAAGTGSITAGAGGGYSAIMLAEAPLVVAGGGGGSADTQIPGGDAGHDGGDFRTDLAFEGHGGGSGTVTDGGLGGDAGTGFPNCSAQLLLGDNGSAGSQLQGGVGGSIAGGSFGGAAGGGGGGGYYGGGGGGAGAGCVPGTIGHAGGGGGGSDFVLAAAIDVSSNADSAANGSVTIGYVADEDSAPVAAPAIVQGGPNAAGWSRGSAVVDWHWQDGSGLDPASCTDQSTSTSEEGAQTLSASCTDVWGNVGTAEQDVKIDSTAPVDAPVVTTTPTGASVAWNWSDALSGVDDLSCTQSSSQTGTGQLTFTSSCTDVAGNTATDSKTVTVTPPPTKADIQEKITGPATGKKGTTYTYTVTTKNVGPAAAADVGTTLLLPGDASVVSVSGSYAKIGPLVVWRTTPSVASGASLTYTVKVKFNGKGTQALAVGAASLRTQDPDLRNNAAVVTTKIS